MKKLIILTLVFALTACGGGGSGADNTSQSDEASTSPVTVDTSHLTVIGADYAHARSITGAGVTIAVFDSGVNIDHSEFGGKKLNQHSASYQAAVSYYSFDEQDDMGLSGLDLYEPIETGPQNDLNGHGTHVSSMVWGQNVGVAPGADLMMMDIYPDQTPDSTTAKGLIQDMGPLGVDFINASLTGVDYYEDSVYIDERPLFEPLDSADIGFIVAAGNYGLDMTETFISNPVDCESLSDEDRSNSLECRFVYNPTDVVLLAKDASLADNFIWVGAVNDDLEPAEFILSDGTEAGTNVPGDDADIQARWITAPGELDEGAFFGDNESYIDVSGTSQAAPLVEGAAALVKSKFPSLSNAAVLQILLDTANASFNGYDPAVYGQGVVDIEAALQVNPGDYATL